MWLSKQVRISEEGALHLTVLECEYRSESRLREGYSEGEVASLKQALGPDYVERQLQARGGSRVGDDPTYNCQKSRRARLIRLHLQQEVLILRLGKELTDLSLVSSNEDEITHPGKILASELRDPGLVHPNNDITTGIDRIKALLQHLESSPSWESEDPELIHLRDVRDAATLKSIEVILETLLLVVGAVKEQAPSGPVRPWFELMSSVAFFASFTSEIESQASTIQNIQSTASFISLIILNVGPAIATLGETAKSGQSVLSGSRPEFFFDLETVTFVHEVLSEAASTGNIHAGPAILAWAFVIQQVKELASGLQETRESQHVQHTLDAVSTFDAAKGRRAPGSSSLSQPTIIEDFLDIIMIDDANDDPSDSLLDAALGQCNVVDYIVLLSATAIRLTTMLAVFKFHGLQELVSVGRSFLGYTPEFVTLQLALLAVDPESTPEPKLFDPAKAFIHDTLLLEAFYDVAAARFPYECLPFLRFSCALAKASIFSGDGTQYVEYRLRSLSTFTQAAARGVRYRTTREDEDSSFVALVTSVNLLDMSQNKLLTYAGQESETTSIIPAETIGDLISSPDTGGPKVIRWHHEFSGLAHFGQLLELHYMGLLATSLSPSEDLEGVVSEIIGVLTTLLSTILQSDTSKSPTNETLQHCQVVLDEVSSSMNPEAEVVLYVFDILEQELQQFRRRTVSTFDCRIMTSCVDFIIVLTKIRPQLIWSSLNRTSLLGHQSASSPIFAVVSGVEAPLRSFEFLEKCTELYQSLIELALTRAHFDGLTATAPSTRSTLPTAWRIQSPMLLTATEIMYQVLQGILDWSFSDVQQQLRITTNITSSFAGVVQFAFGVGPSLDSTSAVTAPFVESATYVISTFRTSGLEGVGLDSTARLLFLVNASNYDSVLGENSVVPENGVFERHARSVLSLTTLLLRYSQVRELPLSSLEENTFNMVPAVVRTLHFGGSIRVCCLRLLRSVVGCVERSQPSSLLGQLGSSSCIDFLNLLRHIDAKAESENVRREVWKLLTQLVKDSQQWLAMVILTGSAPGGSNRVKSDEKAAKCIHGANFLQIAMAELRDIENLPQKVATAMLGFVLQAQQNWSWVNKDLSSSDDFLQKIVRFVTSNRARDLEESGLAIQNLIASIVTDIATTHLHHAKVSKDLNTMKIYVPLVNWLAINAVEVTSYNSSLHANLRRNFSTRYKGLPMFDIKSTGLVERDLGPNFYYDLDFANKLFEHDSAWHGMGGKCSNQSFSAELARANTNLSLVDSELTLLSSLQRMCIDHCNFFVQDREVQKAMARIVQHCLQANSQVYPAEALFKSLFQTRMDLSMALLRELIVFGAKGSDFVGLLDHAWNAVRFRSGSYEQAIIDNDLTYWRSALSVLLMTIQFHVNKKRQTTTNPNGATAIVILDSQNPTFLEIATDIIAGGFKSIVVALQDQKEKRLMTDAEDEADLVGPRDVSILLTLMQTILRLPSLSQFATELADRLSSSGTISSCLVLYSWSHVLSVSQRDTQPRYADYCMQLLASISSLPPVAEELAIEGVLSRILSAKTTEALQRVPGGASHADSRPNCAFLYRIWATGLLPLALNLLQAVGGAIAPEVSAFLNQFPEQLSRASTSLTPTPQNRPSGTDALSHRVASEAATLALLSFGLTSYRNAGASAAAESNTILLLKGYDEHRKAILEDLRDLIAMQQEARRRITVPMDEKESSWQNAKDGDKLDAKIVKELKMAAAALTWDDDDDDDEK